MLYSPYLANMLEYGQYTFSVLTPFDLGIIYLDYISCAVNTAFGAVSCFFKVRLQFYVGTRTLMYPMHSFYVLVFTYLYSIP